MDVIWIAVTLSALFTYTLCDKEILAVEMNIPNLFSGMTALDTAFNSLRHGKKSKMPPGQIIAQKLISKIKSFTALVKMLHRRAADQIRPHVQSYYGAPKPAIMKYPKDYYVNRLKILLKLQEKENQRNKNLNPENQ
ncbi:uncharacterized protein LOC113497683 [Trichoplusia ni]|uniref:Uncharacterized protein LOC113497683 n=1 Tax=Trichoplusia ni TaxID=7111 RepID=A0A7E5VY38_TRINI|nr:uncharacterized protein LOC113497683 [Trichoplusia ni]